MPSYYLSNIILEQMVGLAFTIFQIIFLKGTHAGSLYILLKAFCIYEQTSESLELSHGVCVELGLT